MSKPTDIILLVLLALLLFGIFKILLPSIKIYISRMPKGIFVLLFLVIAGVIVYLVHYLITGATGGNPGNENNSEIAGIERQDEDKPITLKENCIVLSGSEVYVENEKADSAMIEKYIDYRVENNIQITIVDDYSTAALFREIKAICEKKGVRYIIEDEKWLE